MLPLSIYVVGQLGEGGTVAATLSQRFPAARLTHLATAPEEERWAQQRDGKQGIVVFILGSAGHPGGEQAELLAANACRKAAPHAFIVLWHQEATENAQLRTKAYREAGANMVSCDLTALVAALTTASKQALTGTLTCEWCGLQNLTAEDLFHHHPLYHADHEPQQGRCQVCGQEVEDIGWHVHKQHRPPGYPAIPPRTGVYALAVVRRPSDGRFLLVQESGRQGWWLPGGGVDPGEGLRAGAIREALEEAGVNIKLQGVLGVDVHRGGTWRRFIFLAELDPPDQVPKTLPCAESAGACWVSVDELKELPLRGGGVDLHWLPYLADGGKVAPLEVPSKHQAAFADWPF